MTSGKTLACLPIAAFFGYWLYSCPVSALLTGDHRMLLLGFVNLPLLAVLAAAFLKVLKAEAR